MSRSTIRTPAGRTLNQVRQISQFCQRHSLNLRQGFDSIAAMASINSPIPRPHPNTKVAPGIAAQPADSQLADSRSQLSIAIVGAGFAGLACGYELQKSGIRASIFEASDRTGGRCWSMGGRFGDGDRFPGQVVERGGELIDSQHHQLLRYAQEFGLDLEDLSATPGDWTFYFQGSHYPESAVVEEYLDFLQAIQSDLAQLSPEPTARQHTDFDRALDRMSIAEYLDKYDVGPLARGYINASYQGEFGFDPQDQTCLHFLLMNLEQQKNPLEIFSDERYHIAGGNEQITRALTDRLRDQIQLQHPLVKAKRTSAGRIELTFATDGKTMAQTFDVVVMTVPFPALRSVDLDESLELPEWKRRAIAELDNGAQVKMMVGFAGQPWRDHGSNGVSHSDLPHHQVTWEASPTLATPDRSVIVHLASGHLASRLSPDRLQQDTQDFLENLDRIYPGAQAQVRRDPQGQIHSHLEPWITNPLAQGAYLCYRPGQFTAFTGLEGTAVGNLFFAGEHTHSFYEWQGFLEGAALSGIETARQLLR